MALDGSILALVHRLKPKLEALYGERLAGVYVYGSHARGDAHPDSDLDLLVVLNGRVDAWREIDRLVDVAYDLELETGELISLHPVSARRYARADVPLLRTIRREGIGV